MRPSDYVVILSFAVLAMFVLVIERKKNITVPDHVKPQAPGYRIVRDTNVPLQRDHSITLDNVGYQDVTQASQ